MAQELYPFTQNALPQLTSDGVQAVSYEETLTAIEAALTEASGEQEIDFSSNTPNGNSANILASICQIMQSQIIKVNASFDPDQASGEVLYQRCAINGITVKAGTFTFVNISVLINGENAVSLVGLDSNINSATAPNVFTIADSVGNQYYLASSATLNPNATAYLLSFRAKEIGSIQSTIGGITQILTPIIGVTSVVNNSDPVVVGGNQETDSQLRLRRTFSTAKGQKGYVGLQASLLELNGVVSTEIDNNVTQNTNVNTTPAKSVWIIVDGGAQQDIIDTINAFSSGGCQYYTGDTIANNITQYINQNGSQNLISYSTPVLVQLYLQITFTITNPSVTALNTTAIANYIYNQLNDVQSPYYFKVGQIVSQGSIMALINEALEAENPNSAIINQCLLSIDNATWQNDVVPSNINRQFKVSSVSNISFIVS